MVREGSLGRFGRFDPEAGDLVALAADHMEAVAVEGKALAHFRDRLGFMDDEPRHGGGV